jgi:2-polyprenyl-6-methoxyphenol hydroxylase-like FAD-dependent oxidoreductase
MGAPDLAPAAPAHAMHVLIAGGGVVGLTIAQRRRQNGIPFTVFERDPAPDSRKQGWALTLHWSLDALERTIGPNLAKSLDKASAVP